MTDVEQRNVARRIAWMLECIAKQKNLGPRLQLDGEGTAEARLYCRRLVRRIADPELPEKKRAGYVEYAQQQYLDTDDVEVDSDAGVSEGEDGAFVQAWVWVPTQK